MLVRRFLPNFDFHRARERRSHLGAGRKLDLLASRREDRARSSRAADRRTLGCARSAAKQAA